MNSMTSSFSNLWHYVLLILLILDLSAAASTYNLDTKLAGSSFFDNFNFYTVINHNPRALIQQMDSSSKFDYDFPLKKLTGFSYVSAAEAATLGLAGPGPNGAMYIGVDHSTTLSTSAPGRKSVRISSKKSWTHGLFIADIAHMPGGICGTWPAFWSFGPNWPNSGEIDVIEGVNSNHDNLMSLHTSSDCTIAGSGQTGTLQSNNCDGNLNGNAGCGSTASTDSSYGAPFNAISGGVYATEWTSQYIKIWFFPRSNIPQDIANGVPDPETWGTPQANFQGSCDIDSHFANHNLIFDTTFCGDWAANVWSSDPVCKSKAPSCVSYVASNPSAFIDAYWIINSVKVYTLGPAASSTSKKPGSSTKATSSSTSIKSTSVSSAAKKTSSSSPAKTTSPSAKAQSSSAKQTSLSNKPSPSKSPNGLPLNPNTNEASQSYFTYLSCLTTTPTTFTTILTTPNMTIPTCLTACASATKAYAAVHGNLCSCADTLGSTTIGSCHLPCPGNPLQVCGGVSVVDGMRKRLGDESKDWAWSVYVYVDAAESLGGLGGTARGASTVSVQMETLVASATADTDAQTETETGSIASALATSPSAFSDGTVNDASPSTSAGPAPESLSSVTPASSLLGVGMGRSGSRGSGSSSPSPSPSPFPQSYITILTSKLHFLSLPLQLSSPPHSLPVTQQTNK
ncbi:putative endo-1,3(4)-beta-glucanase [Lachnellula willkommii]|uniref:Putative endo-1,3(4)-beta-glucanase n=1 Tax=Lachnellula willkommii TaxID=215461 RepID=A0A559M8V0_9HELO|nr:putative endo-1,3(4)-beta-glucanase [Lachnellula willkommii]